MNNKKPFSVMDRLRSFIYAIAGLKTFFQTEHNSWIHILAASSIIILGKLIRLNNYEWCFIILAIGLVLMAEIFNTAIESLTDIVSPDYCDMAKKVKDVSAAAVLVAAIAALCIGLFVFVPKIFNV